MNYRPLYNLRVGHDYFDRSVCRALRCRISPAEAELWRRRGLLFRQLGDNGWTILYDSDGAGVDTSSDVLALEMDMIDHAFVLYTLWDGFRPDAAYGLELPLKKETADAAKAIRETAPKRGIGSGFCRINIRMTDKLVKAARDGKPMTCTLQFHAPAYRWEYLLVPRDGDNAPTERYLMEETGDKLHFPPFEPVRMYGRDMLRTVSEETVPMHERYGYRLKVAAQAGSTGRNRTVLKHIDPPEPGRFMNAEAGLLRQICSL